MFNHEKENKIRKALNDLQGFEAFTNAVANIKSGRFDRDANCNDYADRKIYTKYLRMFVYDPSTMNLIWSDHDLKVLFLETFGYKGSVDFTIYPDAWLRDLPLLNIGKGTYLGDGILLGTNQVSPDQKTLQVGQITIGEYCVFNQRCMIGYDTTIGDNSKFGIETGIGIKCKISDDCQLGDRVSVGHFTRVGSNVTLGNHCKVGNFCIIDEGVVVDEYTEIPSFSHVTKHGIVQRRRQAA